MPVGVRRGQVVVQQASHEEARQQPDRGCALGRMTRLSSAKTGDVGHVARGRCRIAGRDQLRDDVFERRTALHQGAQLIDPALGDDSSAMEHDDVHRKAARHGRERGAVDDRLAPRRQGWR